MSDTLSEIRQSWQPPPELGARPRPVRLTGLGVFMVAFAAVLAVGGIVAGSALWRQAQRESRREALLDRSGQRAEGRIERLWKRHSGKSSTPMVAYSYPVAGKTYQGDEAVHGSDWKAMWEGQRVTVVFVPSEPGTSRLAEFADSGGVPFFAAPLMTLVFFAVAVVLAVLVFRERRLLEDGRPAAGVVTRVGGRTDKGRYIYYEFATLGGSRAKGRFGPVRGKAVPAIGSPVTVLYEPDNPKRNGAYPTQLVKIRK